MKKNNLILANKIKIYLKKSNKPLILLISGVNGSGKTTLAFHISNLLEIKQRVGLGSIVKTLIVMNPKNKVYQKMDNYFLGLTDKELKTQSLILGKIVDFIIKKYQRGGVSSIIEGVQLLPDYFSNNCIHFHIKIDDLDKYKKQLNNKDTRYSRNISLSQFRNLLKVNGIFDKEVSRSKIFFIKNSNSIDENISDILKKIIISLNLK